MQTTKEEAGLKKATKTRKNKKRWIGDWHLHQPRSAGASYEGMIEISHGWKRRFVEIKEQSIANDPEQVLWASKQILGQKQQIDLERANLYFEGENSRFEIGRASCRERV